MKSFTRTILLPVFCSLLIASVRAQNIPPENQFSQKINQADRNKISVDGNWSFGLATGASLSLQNNEAALFHGGGFFTKMFARYYFGAVGLGASTGFSSGSINNNGLNQFITNRNLSQIQVTKSNPFNSYFLFGPSFRFGGKVYLDVDLQGGLFLNNPGSVNISQQGSTKSVYNFSSGSQNIFPGFSGSASINYLINNSTHFFINADYLQSTSQVSLLDMQNGIDVPRNFNRSLQMMFAGVGIVKSFGRNTEHVKNRLAGINNEAMMIPQKSLQNCGPVTLTTNKPDGSVEQLTFTCPGDAAQYNQQLGNPSTTHSQTSTDKSATGYVSGKVYWSSANMPGIITNEMVASNNVESRLKNPGDYNLSSHKTADDGQIVHTLMYTRNSSGVNAKSNVDYLPFFNEVNNTSCENCGITMRAVGYKDPEDMASRYRPGNNKTTRINFGGGSNAVEDPMFQSNSYSKNIDRNLCSITPRLFVVLMNATTSEQIAETTTDSCGNFWFANLPQGLYTLRIYGSGAIQKAYQINNSLEGKQDMAGEIMPGDAQLSVILNTGISNGESDNARATNANSIVQPVPIPVRGVPIKGVGVSLGKVPGGGCAAKDAGDPINGIGISPNSSIIQKAHEINSSKGQQDIAGISNGETDNARATNANSIVQPVPIPVRGVPIKGVGISLGKVPGGGCAAKTTDNNGSFEVTGLGKGKYLLIANIPYSFDKTTVINVGANCSR